MAVAVRIMYPATSFLHVISFYFKVLDEPFRTR